jgi:putative ABC transport system permease protein
MKNILQKAGSFYTLGKVAWRNIWRNSRRTALCIVAVGISVFFIVIMQSWMDGMTSGMEEIVRTFDTGHVLLISEKFESEREYFPVQYPVLDGKDAGDIIAEIEQIEGVKAALPRIMTYASLFDSMKKHAFLWGLDIPKEIQTNNLNFTDRSDGLVDGRFPRPGSNECMIGTAMADDTGLQLGDKIPLKTVSSQFSDKYWSPVIVGIFEFDYTKFDEETIVVPIDKLQSILGLENGAQQIVVYAEKDSLSTMIHDTLSSWYNNGTLVKEWIDNYWIAMFQSFIGVYIIVFAVFQIVASFLIINTMLMVIHERIKEIGMMGALGMSRFEIVLVFFLEALFLSILGATAGAIAGGLASYLWSLFPIDMATFTGGGMKDFPIVGTLYLDFSVQNIIRSFFFGVLVSALCVLVPSMRSAFIKPVEALRR